jgi:hypothetical protein
MMRSQSLGSRSRNLLKQHLALLIKISIVPNSAIVFSAAVTELSATSAAIAIAFTRKARVCSYIIYFLLCSSY